ncbi:MAG: hypothetical protein FWD03_02255 [Defluviitaleaceae bacterium]|nr:hypothetical protein [Defluviitaleaceae bacterium]
MIDVLIDKLTPCLEEISTGKIFQTTFSVADNSEIIGLQDKGWNFNWADKELNRSNVYKLQLKQDDVIQGLISAEVTRGAVYVRLLESAPHNLGTDKQFNGVGGHLFAIAIKLSYAMGFNGYIFFETKNMSLVEHYSDKFGANLIPTRIHLHRMEINEINAQRLLENYSLEGDLNVR